MAFVYDPGLGQGFTVQGYLALVDLEQAGCRANCHGSISGDRSILIRFSFIVYESTVQILREP